MSYLKSEFAARDFLTDLFSSSLPGEDIVLLPAPCKGENLLTNSLKSTFEFRELY